LSIELADPYLCFQCGRCVSVCSVANFVKDYRPHRIVSSSRLGLIDKLLSSDYIWLCARCFRCTEYCPQDVAPAELVSDLQFLAVSRGIQKPPEAYEEMLKLIALEGRAFKPMEVVDRDFELQTRETLGLPPLKKPRDLEIVSNNIEKLKKMSRD